MNDSNRSCVAITGAGGFVGSALCEALESKTRVVALGRRFPSPSGAPSDLIENGNAGIERRRCDLFSIPETELALKGADVAVYLVHSMSPNARLTQGSFENLDLLLADNFARAARQAGVKRIVYLGGLLPSDPSRGLSPHLQSRLEVEHALAAHGVPVTAIRAGLIVGAEGSSLNLLVRLVERLPIMVCPSWTLSKTQPIGLSDVIEILEYCCLNASTSGRIAEVGGPDVMSYRQMMKATSSVLERRRPMLPVPLVPPALSELWVSIVTGSPRSLVRPLIESLRHPMVVTDPWLQNEMGHVGAPFKEALAKSLHRSRVWKRPIARSIQRFNLPAGRDATWVAHEYPKWLERFAPWLIIVDTADDRVTLRLRSIEKPLLILDLGQPQSGVVTETDRVIFYVAGGLLAGPAPAGQPRLEFRTTPDGESVLAALQDFEPSLPWWLYTVTQAPLHRAVMAAYQFWLTRSAQRCSA